MKRFVRRLWACAVGMLFLNSVRADDAASAPVVPSLNNAELAPALKDAAEVERIALFTSSDVGELPAEADALVFWIGARSGKTSQQWLIRLTRGVSTPNEQKAHRGKEITKYLSWGPVVAFQSEVAALDLWIAGPVDTTARSDGNVRPHVPARVLKTRVFVAQDFLRIGLDKSERVASHITRRSQQIVAEDPSFNLGNIYSLEEPIKPANIAYAKPVAERLGLTPEMAQSWVGGFVALQSFYELANRVLELKEIAEIACEKPSVLKLARLAFGTQLKTNFGGANRDPVDSGKIGLLPVPMESFDAPFSFQIGDDPIVGGHMLVTKPMPPLDVSAGILALLAVHPKDKTRVVELRAISTQRGRVSERMRSEAP